MIRNRLDKRSFILGMVTAFSECVAGGCKPLAFSPPLNRTDYEYNESGLKIKEISFDLMGQISSWIEYEYDAKNNYTKVTIFRPDGTVYRYYIPTYDSEGTMLEENGYSENDELIYRAEYEYNDTGNNTVLTQYDGDGNIKSRYEYTYDSKGNIVSKVKLYSDGSVSERTEYQYDENNNEVKRLIFKTDGSIDETIEYEWQYFDNTQSINE